MGSRYAISIVLAAHVPFVREHRKDDNLSQSGEEGRFFEYVSETLLPLLGVLDRLESDHVPFYLGLAVSPILMFCLAMNTCKINIFIILISKLNLASRK